MESWQRLKTRCGVKQKQNLASLSKYQYCGTHLFKISSRAHHIFSSKCRLQFKSFFVKKTFYWTWIWKIMLSKKDAQGSYYWAQKKFQQEKIKIEGVAFISKKNLKSHFRDPKKRFFSISYFEKCFYMLSLPTANCRLVWPNFCTPYPTRPPIYATAIFLKGNNKRIIK